MATTIMGSIGIMEKKMETTIMGYIGDSGKEHESYNGLCVAIEAQW